MFRILLLLALSSFSCGEPGNPARAESSFLAAPTAPAAPISLIDSSGTNIETRFLCPEGYVRTQAEPGSFAQYLRSLPLKPDGASVLTYDGRIKPNRGVYHAVVDLPIGSRDLHQCADAVMRLRAEYLYQQKAYDQIHFHFTNGFRADYTQWMAGKRISVNGNQVSWRASAAPSTSPESFWKYLEIIFSYAGTLSLDKELNVVPLTDLQVGDVFIQGGSPGHAVIVVDKAHNPENGEILFMLAQSYMPAQEIQVLQNPLAPRLSPWYAIPDNEILLTPEWRFSTTQLKRF